MAYTATAMPRILRSVPTGPAIGADEVGRYLNPAQRAALVERLSADVQAQAAAILGAARAQAAEILENAGTVADAARAQARQEGWAEGHAQGVAAARAEIETEMAPLLALLRRAADEAQAVRESIMEGVEEQAVALAVEAARRVVGAAAQEHTDLAVSVVRSGLRAAGGKVIRIRVNPADAEAVSVALLDEGNVFPVHPDAEIEAGGCIINVEGGTVDLRPSRMFERVASTLVQSVA